MKVSLYCKRCEEVTEQEHMERRLCICTCGQENFIGVNHKSKTIDTRTSTMNGAGKKLPRGRQPALTMQQAEEVKRLGHAKLGAVAIGLRFGVTAQVIRRVLTGKGAYNGNRA